MKPRSTLDNPLQEVPPAALPGRDPFFWREQWRLLKLAHCAVPNYGNAGQFWANRKMIRSVYIRGRTKAQRRRTIHGYVQ